MSVLGCPDVHAALCLVCAHDARVVGGGLEREPSQGELTQGFLTEMDL